jgi:hypothetical protein
MTRRLKPIQRKSNEAVQEQLTPYNLPKASKDTAFTENRAHNVSQKEDDANNISVGLEDIDKAIKYYFENVIKPSVVIKGQRTPVPILYANQELWKTIQSDGYLRDKNGKMMTPLITFKRDTVEKNRNLGNKQDANNPSLYQVFEKKYNKRNHYDAFSVLTNRVPNKEYIMTVVPDYVTISYSCVIFTEYMEQLNPLIEAINYASDSYWGDLNRFKFKAYINQFSTVTELNIGEDRAVKSTFNIVLQGYIIPNTINKDLVAKNRVFSTSQIVFKLETSSTEIETLAANQRPVAGSLGSTSLIENNINISNVTNITVNNYGTATQLELVYVNTNLSRIAAVVTSDTATFENTHILQPPTGSQLPETNSTQFKFFVNGQYVSNSAILAITEVGNMVNVIFSTEILGFTLEADDEVEGRGKWRILDNSVEGVILTENGYYLITEDGSYILYI